MAAALAGAPHGRTACAHGRTRAHAPGPAGWLQLPTMVLTAWMYFIFTVLLAIQHIYYERIKPMLAPRAGPQVGGRTREGRALRRNGSWQLGTYGRT